MTPLYLRDLPLRSHLLLLLCMEPMTVPTFGTLLLRRYGRDTPPGVIRRSLLALEHAGLARCEGLGGGVLGWRVTPDGEWAADSVFFSRSPS